MKYIYTLATIVSVLLLATGCKKEYEQTPFNYTDILSFSYKDSGGVVKKAAINGDSIIVYWPTYTADTVSIVPTIVVAENATVTPGSGATIKLVNGAVVTVTAEDGTKKVYYIKLIQNISEIVLRELIPYYFDRGLASSQFYYNGNDDIRNLYTEAPDTKFFVLKDNGTEVELPSNLKTAPGAIIFKPGFTIDTGWYKLKIVNAGRIKTSVKKVVWIRYAVQLVDRITAAVTMKKGETLTFRGQFTQDFSVIYPGNFNLQFQKVTWKTANPGYGEVVTSEVLGTFTFKAVTDTSITFNVPAGLPAGVYTYGEGYNGADATSYRFVRTNNNEPLASRLSAKAKFTITE